MNGVEAVENDLQEFDKLALQADHVWVTGHSLGGALGWGLIQIHAIIMAARARPER
jgi:putative lipase involved disintegration of autophagic bodies